MFSKFINDMKNEQKLIKELDFFIEEYYRLLNNSDMIKIAEDGSFPDELLFFLDSIEECRLKLITGWLNVSRSNAINMRLEALENYLKTELSEQMENIEQYKNELLDVLAKMN
jgi:hypothetical protein